MAEPDLRNLSASWVVLCPLHALPCYILAASASPSSIPPSPPQLTRHFFISSRQSIELSSSKHTTAPKNVYALHGSALTSPVARSCASPPDSAPTVATFVAQAAGTHLAPRSYASVCCRVNKCECPDSFPTK